MILCEVKCVSFAIRSYFCLPNMVLFLVGFASSFIQISQNGEPCFIFTLRGMSSLESVSKIATGESILTSWVRHCWVWHCWVLVFINEPYVIISLISFQSTGNKSSNHFTAQKHCEIYKQLLDTCIMYHKRYSFLVRQPGMQFLFPGFSV